MKKIILVLLPLVFLFVSCEEFGIPGLSFDYEYDFNAPIQAPIKVDSTVRVNVSVVNNDLGEELSRRGVQFIEDIELKSLTLVIPDSVALDFSVLKDFAATLVLDGKEFPLGFAAKIAEIAVDGGKKLTVKSDESMPGFALMKDVDDISLLYDITLKEELIESTEIKVSLNTTVTTAFVE